MKTPILALGLALVCSTASAEFSASFALSAGGAQAPTINTPSSGVTPSVPVAPAATANDSGNGEGLLLMLLVVGAIIAFGGESDDTQRSKAPDPSVAQDDDLLMRF